MEGGQLMRFHDLIGRLVDEHNREVLELRRQICHLHPGNQQVSGELRPCDGSTWDSLQWRLLGSSTPDHSDVDVLEVRGGVEVMQHSEQKHARMGGAGDVDVLDVMQQRMGGSVDVMQHGVQKPARMGGLGERWLGEGLDPAPLESGVESALANVARTSALDSALKNELETDKTVITLFGMCSDERHLFQTVLRVWWRFTRYIRSNSEFHLLQTWTDRLSRKSDKDMAADELAVSGTAQLDFLGDLPRKPHPARGVIIHPNSMARVGWDFIGAILLLFDVITIPMQVFEMPLSSFLDGMDWLTLVFWTCDMFASCITGYVSKGSTVMAPNKIRLNYVKTWLTFDVLVLGPDWAFMVWQMGGGGQELGSSSSGKLIKISRGVRMTRLLRVAKMQRFIAMMRDHIDSEFTFIMLNIVRLLTMLLFVNHFLATVWYWIGATTKLHHLPNWIDAEDFLDDSIGYRYTTSLHWSLTQFTPASMSVQPQNVVERTFAIICLVFGLVLFSCLISAITSSMTQLANKQDDRSRQFWLLRRYLRQHKVPSPLCFRVLRYIEYQSREGAEIVAESRVHILDMLSDQLRNELKFTVSFACLSTHPLFEKADTISDGCMKQLAAGALLQSCLASGDTLFRKGTPATHMYVIVSEVILYSKYGLELDVQELFEDDWLAEAALWTGEWVHVGSAVAKQDCKTVCIESQMFAQVISKDFPTYSLVSVYAKNCLAWLNAQSRGHLSDASEAREARPTVSLFMES